VSEVFWESARYGGLPFLLVLTALISGAAGRWLFRTTHDLIVKGKDEQIADLREQLKQQRAEHAEDTVQLRSERDRAVAMALEGWSRAEHALDVVGVPKPSPLVRGVRQRGARTEGAG
jgi:hypothetical protein